MLLCRDPVSSLEPSKVRRGQWLEGSPRADAFLSQEGGVEAGEDAPCSSKGGGLHYTWTCADSHVVSS